MDAFPTLRIALDWAANPNHSGLLVAQQRGMFATAGVTVHIVPAEVAHTPLDVLRAGDADLAFAFAGTVIEARMAGEPIISVAAVTRHHHSALVALRSSGIRRAADLHGKRYASFGHPVFERSVIAAMQRYDGVASPQVDLRSVRFASVAGLQRDEFDYLWIYEGIEGIEAEAQGIDLVHLAPGAYGVPDYYAPTLITHERVLRDAPRRAALQRVLLALRQGYSVAAAEPAAILPELQLAAPAAGGWLFDDAGLTSASQHFVSQHYLDPDDTAQWGVQSTAIWHTLLQFLQQAEAFTGVAVPQAQQCFTNDLFEM